MATLRLYNKPVNEPDRQLISYPIGTIDFDGMTEGTHYTKLAETRTHSTVLGKDIYSLKFSFSEGAFPFINIGDTIDPLGNMALFAYQEDGTGDYYYAYNNCDINAQLIHAQPADWMPHWRDKYNPVPKTTLPGTEYHIVTASPNRANTIGGDPTERTFEADVYAATNQCRTMFFTKGDNYFTLCRNLRVVNEGGAQGVVDRISFADPRVNTTTTVDYGYFWVDTPKIGSLYGLDNYIWGYSAGSLFASSAFSVYPSAMFNYPNSILLNTHCCFIGFQLTWDYTDQTVYPPVTETVTENFIGILIWKTSLDGIPQEGEMTAISLDFFLSRDAHGNWGPDTGVEGGDGIWTHETTGPDDADGKKLKKEIEDNWRDTKDAVLTAAGLHYYNVGETTFNELCGLLWQPTLWTNFQNQQYSPLDAILACQLIPGDFIQTEGTAPIKVAYQATTHNAQVINHTIVWKEMSTDMTPIYEVLNQTGSFQNFAGYCSAYIHLPYIGNVSIDIQQCAEGTLSVFYACDVLSGDLTAFVYATDRNGSGMYIGEYKGNCAEKVPLFMRTTDRLSTVGALTENARSFTNNLFDMGKSVISGAKHATDSSDPIDKASNLLGDVQNLTNVIGNQWENTADTIANTVKLINPKQTITGTNVNFGSTSPTWTECWLCLSFPEPSNSQYYDGLIGLPSDVGGTINNSESQDGPFTGFLAVREIKLDNITATDNEKKEIELLMKSGVYLDNEMPQ